VDVLAEAQLRSRMAAGCTGANLYDLALPWLLRPRWWQGEPLELELELAQALSPDDGA